MSNLGRVRDLAGDILSPDYLEDDGTPVFILDTDTLRMRPPLWRMVIDAFVENLPSDYWVHHIDGNKHNNDLENLALMTEDGPIYFRYEFDNRGMLYASIDRRSRGRVQINETGDVYNNASSAAKAVGGNKSHVSAVLRGGRKSHRGYTFKYV